MRGPVLNISPGLTANGVDMEYRRNAQGKLMIIILLIFMENPHFLSSFPL